MTTIHTRQLQQYTQDNYNNAHKTTNNNTHNTTTTVHRTQLQRYTQDNYNNIYKTTTTIHTRQLQQYTQDNQQKLFTRQLKTSNNTRETNYNTTCTKGKNTQARQYCIQFIVIVHFLCKLTKGQKLNILKATQHIS